ncbi:uncharacterized protein MYCGRDRAFT_97920 [Zymoseptoria tritici IPO323]|uniref:Uncharacterized protein n=1 Tax=Zymoseptoria tritici (strain CBS 115943 / IPO323) TaxID=336722 RepID=F9XRS4_ZYMTI|nr:uncharacterized protein MYCGRDRAFT_97920 [Zymoseptoria tritici IPO323]EGP81966.1 hypothetical protein MYCGRDRAFT_97920 [Zymoseptoria tritici IPO323]
MYAEGGRFSTTFHHYRFYYYPSRATPTSLPNNTFQQETYDVSNVMSQRDNEAGEHFEEDHTSEGDKEDDVAEVGWAVKAPLDVREKCAQSLRTENILACPQICIPSKQKHVGIGCEEIFQREAKSRAMTRTDIENVLEWAVRIRQEQTLGTETWSGSGR